MAAMGMVVGLEYLHPSVSPAISPARALTLWLFLPSCGGSSSGGPQPNRTEPHRTYTLTVNAKFGFCDGGSLSYLDRAVEAGVGYCCLNDGPFDESVNRRT